MRKLLVTDYDYKIRILDLESIASFEDSENGHTQINLKDNTSITVQHSPEQVLSFVLALGKLSVGAAAIEVLPVTEDSADEALD